MSRKKRWRGEVIIVTSTITVSEPKDLEEARIVTTQRVIGNQTSTMVITYTYAKLEEKGIELVIYAPVIIRLIILLMILGSMIVMRKRR